MVMNALEHRERAALAGTAPPSGNSRVQDGVPASLLASPRIAEIRSAGFELTRMARVAKDSPLLLDEGDALYAIVAGWAGYQQVLADGRRQIVNIVLPGDVVGRGLPFVRALGTPVALTDTSIASLEPADETVSPRRDELLRTATDLIEAQLAAHLVRIGRMSSYERLIDFFRAMRDRLELAGLVEDGRFEMPLGQVQVADALGMSAIHVSRTMSQLKAVGVITHARSMMILREELAVVRPPDSPCP